MHHVKVRGRIFKRPTQIRDVRDLMRQHLYDARLPLSSLTKVWGVTHTSVYRLFYDKRYSIPPDKVDAFIDYMQLDEFDAQELRLQGAIDSGWKLNMEMKV